MVIDHIIKKGDTLKDKICVNNIEKMKIESSDVPIVIPAVSNLVDDPLA